MLQKLLLGGAAIMACQIAIAQPTFQENFATEIPATFVLINDANTPATQVAFATNAWTHFNAPNIGGLARSTSWFTPAGTADRWLITPSIQVPTGAFLTWKAGAVDQSFADGYEVRLSTGGTTAADFSTVLFSTPGEGAPMVSRAVSLSAYANQNVRIAFRNNSNDKFILYVDEITVLPITTLDVTALNIDIPTTIGTSPSREIKGSIQNLGIPLNSLTINYSVNGGAPVSQNFTGVNIQHTETFNYTFNTQWTPAGLGSYTIKVWASGLNGSTDANNANDTATVVVDVISGSPRYSVSEKFTSSTCPPCASWNNQLYKAKFSSEQWNTFNSDKGIINYQVTIPSAGDPSVNDHGNSVRRQYYAINAAPTLVVAGTPVVWADYGIQTLSDAGVVIDNLTADVIAVPALMDIDIATNTLTQVDATKLKIDVSGKLTANSSLAAGTYTLHIAVLNKNYVFPGAQNGDTDYKHTMRRMLPDANGTAIPAVAANGEFSFAEEFTFDVGNVTAGSFNLWNNDVEIIVFVQNTATKEIMQGAYSYTNTIGLEELNVNSTAVKMYPNPAKDVLNVEIDANKNGKAQIEIMNALGQVVYNSGADITEGNNTISINTSDLKAGLYIINVTANGSSRTLKFNVAH